MAAESIEVLFRDLLERCRRFALETDPETKSGPTVEEEILTELRAMNSSLSRMAQSYAYIDAKTKDWKI